MIVAKSSSILSTTLAIGTCLCLSDRADTTHQGLRRLVLPCMNIGVYFTCILVAAAIGIGPIIIIRVVGAVVAPVISMSASAITSPASSTSMAVTALSATVMILFHFFNQRLPLLPEAGEFELSEGGKSVADVYAIKLRAMGVSPVRVTLVDAPRVWAHHVETCRIDLGHGSSDVLHFHHEVGFMSLPYGLNRDSDLNVISRTFNALGKLFHFGLVHVILSMGFVEPRDHGFESHGPLIGVH